MVNNEFHIIGIATSNYVNIGNDRFVSHLLRVEVEKFKTKGVAKSFELEIQVYGTNSAVDTSAEIIGHQVAINGYVDSYRTKDDTLIIKLVGQNVYVLDSVAKPVIGNVAEAKNPSIVANADKLVGLDESVANYIGSSGDDDLPF